jgi:sulfur-oxidizing protein SoxY
MSAATSGDFDKQPACRFAHAGYKHKRVETMDVSNSAATRRQLLAAGAGLGAAALVRLEPARATPVAMQAAIRRMLGEASTREGKVKLSVPPLVENGNTVPLEVAVESPMTADDYVKAIHVFNEKNPQPNVISVRLSSRAGRARFTTRFRLADTQTVVAIAELSDGSFWSARAEVIVTLAACVEELG